MRLLNSALLFCIIFACTSKPAQANQDAQPNSGLLHVGWAQIDITPQRPVALVGQLQKRISQAVMDPLTATALALETRKPNGSVEQAIMVSCDIIYIRKAVSDRLKEAVKPRIEDFDSDKLFLNATHTHTGPGFIDGAFKGLYDVSKDEGVMKASEYADYFIERVAACAVEAWKARKPAAMSWGLGHAVVGMNRRATYFDGTAAMYGATNIDSFAGIEGYEDHAVEMLFFWNQDRKPTGIVINIACTAQETENLNEISADFWHDVRVELRKRIAQDIFIFPQTAAAGNLSPHLLYRRKAEEAMRNLRGLSRRQEIARRIADAVEDVLPLVAKHTDSTVRFQHKVARLNIPEQQGMEMPFYNTDPAAPIEFHVLRLEDIAIATNPFELYIEYGVRIKARSPATLTFLVQIACEQIGYLPTIEAVKGGGYSADKFIVGPEGGQVLVNETVRLIKEMWN
ncbi:MAG: hypothetical protein JXN61_04275 [Sedimentisphaerales bacterium]|nr:hypothetical protein [Sedimentisphaerales bacterium]